VPVLRSVLLAGLQVPLPPDSLAMVQMVVLPVVMTTLPEGVPSKSPLTVAVSFSDFSVAYATLAGDSLSDVLVSGAPQTRTVLNV
jgi:hypothetical protein